MSALKRCLDFLYKHASSTEAANVHKCEAKIKEIEQICSARLSENELSKFFT